MIELEILEFSSVYGAGRCACFPSCPGAGAYIGKTDSWDICNDHCAKRSHGTGRHRVDPDCSIKELSKCFTGCSTSIIGMGEWILNDGSPGPYVSSCMADCRSSWNCESVPRC